MATIGSFAQADVLTTKLHNDGSIAWRHRYDATQLSSNPSNDSVAAAQIDLFDNLLVAVNANANAALDIVILRYAANALPEQPPASINAPSELTTTTTARSVSLRWIDASANEAAFAIERCSKASCSNFVQIASVGAGATSFTDTTVSSRTTYRYRVRAAAGNIVSAYSNIVSLSTLKK